jgi:PAS domain S-box-containing protein
MLKLKLKQASLVELFIVAVFSALLIANAWGTFFANEDVIMPMVISVLIAMAFIFFVRTTMQRDASEHLRASLYKISDAASSTIDLRGLFRLIHEVVAEIVPDKRIFIALYDETKKTVEISDFVDTCRPDEELSVEELIDQVIRSGDRVVIYRQKTTGKVLQRPDQTNISAAEHLAIPLRSPDGEMLGALVVQADAHGKVISEAQMEMLNIISNQVAVAIHRKQTEFLLKNLNAELECRIDERSAEVADLYDNAPCGYHSLDKEGVFVQINRTELNWLGYEREELLGKVRFRSLLSPQSAQVFNQLFALVQKRGYGEPVEYEVVRKDGSCFPVLVNATARIDEAGKFLHSRATVFDITERKKQEKRQSRQRQTLEKLALGASRREILDSIIRYLSEEMPDAVCSILIVDAEKRQLLLGARSGLPTGVAVINQCGVIQDDISPLMGLQRPSLEIYRLLMQNAGFVAEHTEWIIAGNEQLLGALVIHWRQDKPISSDEMELMIEAAHWAGIAIENVNNREQLRKLSTAVEQSPAATVITDLRGNIIYVNPRFTDVTGYSPTEAIGKNPRILKSGRTPPEVYPDLWQTITAGREWKGEFLNRKRNGGLFWEKASITAIRDEQGEVSAYLAVKEDITEQKFAQQALLRAKEEAESATRMKSAFLANISHEIRTPMNAILGFTELLLRDVSLANQQRHYLNIISRSGEHLLELLNDVLETSKIEAGQMRIHSVAFDIRVMLDYLDSMFRQKIEDKALVFRVDADRLEFVHYVADQQKLRQIVINLLGNALKFTQKGRIDLRLWTEPLVGDESKECNLFIEVEDTGMGIAASEHEAIFQVFNQTREGALAGGTGLGLSISRSLARMMGGDIVVESEPGKGSCFRVHIQTRAVADARRCPEQRRVVGLAEMKLQPRILIVDDEKLNRELLRSFLQQIGFSVCEAAEGPDALKLAESWQPDLVLMDVMMPEMDGYETTKRIHLQQPELKVVGVSANVFEEAERRAQECGMISYIRKPYKEQELLDTLAELLALKYLYEEVHVAAGFEATATNCVDLDISSLAVDKVLALKQAASYGDYYQLLEILDGVATSAKGPLLEAVQCMREMVGKYDYEGLEILLESRGNHDG